MVTISKAQESFNEILRRAVDDKERVILTRNGKKLAAVIPIEDLEMIEELEDRIDIREAAKARAEYERDGGIALAELKQELGL